MCPFYSTPIDSKPPRMMLSIAEPIASEETHRPPSHFALQGKDKPKKESHYRIPTELTKVQ